jgi:hypothetical protein
VTYGRGRSHRRIRRTGALARRGNGLRIRLLVLAVCCLAAAGLSIPAMSVGGRLLASSKAAAGRTPADPGPINAKVQSTATATAASSGAAASCSALYFISVRGSGENSSGPNDQKASAETYAAYVDIKNQLKAEGVNPGTTFYQLPYSAPSTKLLTTGLEAPTLDSRVGLTVAADWLQLMDINLPKYIAGEEQGESLLYAYLAQIYHTCSSAGKQPVVVMAGFSQGSMVIHNLLNTIAASDQTDFMSMIKGAVLIADPERMPDSDVANFGTARLSDYGLCHALDILPLDHSHVSASCVPPGDTTDVSSYFSSVAYQVCDTDDLVCDTSGLFKLKRDVPSFTNMFAFMTDVRLGTQTHTLSYTGGEMRTAGRRVARSLVSDGLGGQPSTSPSSPPSTQPASSTWTAIEAPGPAGGYDVELRSVACPSATCVAVGFSGVNSDGGDAFVIEAGSGSSWTAQSVPLPVSQGELSGESGPFIACATSSACVAVGNFIDGTGGPVRSAFATGGPGSSWTASEPPLPANALAGGDVELNSVTCPTSTQCVAVGWYTDTSDQPEGLVLTGLGSSWQAAEVPAPANASSNSSTELYSVACASSSKCVIAGNYDIAGSGSATSAYGAAFFLTGWGSSWTATQAPVPADVTNNPNGTFSDLVQVVCPGTGCVAIGSYTNTSNQLEGLLEVQSGSSWTPIEAPVPADAATDSGAGDELSGIGCTSSAACTAWGFYKDTAGNYHDVVVTGSGSSWTATSVASSPSAGWYTVQGTVACLAASCVISPAYNLLGGLMTSNGSVWTAIAVPLPSGDQSASGGELNGVACSPSRCIAVGIFNDSDGDQGLLEIGPEN